MNYRREIDGLRGLAVLAIIGFHAGFTPFGGGYVGVDIFFVISGYLITSIALEEIDAGRFKLSAFYERRARRILPALGVVLLACLPLAWWLLPPTDMKSFATALAAVTSFVSNLYFWKSTGYFVSEAEFMPLLHTWSLAVEEQFYLIFPLLLMLACRRGRSVTVALLGAAWLISFVLAAWGSAVHPVAAFYLLPTRAWELLTGAALAFSGQRLVNATPVRVREALGLLGLGLIAWAVIGFDRYVKTPGLPASLPVAGAALVILYATADTLSAKLLRWRVLGGVGLVSYGAYLWHQPLFAFARHASDNPPGAAVMAVLVLLTFILATFSWWCVERPFRNRQMVSRPRLAWAGVVCAVAIVSFVVAAWSSGGFERRYNDSERRMLSFLAYPYQQPYRDAVCFIDVRHVMQAGSFEACAPKPGTRSIAMWGDSHAAALSSGFHALETNFGQYTVGGCPPLLNVDPRVSPHCQEAGRVVLAKIVAVRPDEIYIHANWLIYAALDLPSELRRTVAYLVSALPGVRITLVGMAPQWYPSLPATMVRQHRPFEDGQQVKMALPEALAAADKLLEAIAAEQGVRFYSVVGALCRDGACRATTLDPQGHVALMTWDYGHMTEAGARVLAAQMIKARESPARQ